MIFPSRMIKVQVGFGMVQSGFHTLDTLDLGAFHGADQIAVSSHKCQMVISTLISTLLESTKAVDIQLALKGRIARLPKEAGNIGVKEILSA